MTLEDQLIAAVAAEPDDEGPQLVLADWLQSIGDARGELILLDHRDRALADGLRDPEALERLLLLAAEYGFPRARELDEPPLPFVGGGGHPVQFEVRHAGHHYFVRYRHHTLSVTIDDGAIDSGVDYPDGYEDFELESSGEWTPEEERMILTVLGAAIRAGTPLADVRFPCGGVPLPSYPGGPYRVYALPAAYREPRGIARDRYGLAVRDYHRWHRLWNCLRRG